MKIYPFIIKRFFDILMSIFFLTLLSPLIILAILLLLPIFGKNIMFFQLRPGYKGRIFKIWKFRTLYDLYDSHGNLLPDKERSFLIGNFLRKSSIDELPQIFNILVGEMSIIGPRPLLVEYLPLYNSEQMKRHDVLPGITGYAQVMGRNDLDWNKKFDLDLYYVQNISFLLDVKISFLTIFALLRSQTVDFPKKFEGNL